MENLIDEMAGYVCDNLCMYRYRNDMTEKELEVICMDCKLGEYVCGILNEQEKVATTKDKKQR